MLHIDSNGRVLSPKVKLAISPAIERGEMRVIHGIVVHQTDSPTAVATLNGYKIPKSNGAHFLIDKDSTIYQTASIYKKTHHVGWIKSRCIVEHSCSSTDLRALKNKRPGAPIGRIEARKPFPQRYPFNEDAIGIENVGEAFPKKAEDRQKKFEHLTSQQQESLRWLIHELTQTLKISMSEIFRHSEVSWKLETEGASARW